MVMITCSGRLAGRGVAVVVLLVIRRWRTELPTSRWFPGHAGVERTSCGGRWGRCPGDGRATGAPEARRLALGTNREYVAELRREHRPYMVRSLVHRVLSDVASVSPERPIPATGPGPGEPAQRCRPVSSVPAPRHAIRLPQLLIVVGPPVLRSRLSSGTGVITISIDTALPGDKGCDIQVISRPRVGDDILL